MPFSAYNSLISLIHSCVLLNIISCVILVLNLESLLRTLSDINAEEGIASICRTADSLDSLQLSAEHIPVRGLVPAIVLSARH